MNPSKPQPHNKLNFKIRTHGIILGTERFEACVAFYRDILELPVLKDKRDASLCYRNDTTAHPPPTQWWGSSFLSASHV
jgi:catechol 2,3-dioxygenase-like lactoylglutathione lyase family enzyme